MRGRFEWRILRVKHVVRKLAPAPKEVILRTFQTVAALLLHSFGQNVLSTIDQYLQSLNRGCPSSMKNILADCIVVTSNRCCHRFSQRQPRRTTEGSVRYAFWPGMQVRNRDQPTVISIQETTTGGFAGGEIQHNPLVVHNSYASDLPIRSSCRVNAA